MDSDQITKAAAQIGWNIHEDWPFNSSETTEVANLRMSYEVAYQLAFLNEQIGTILNTSDAQIRVRVEPGDWPILTTPA